MEWDLTSAELPCFVVLMSTKAVSTHNCVRETHWTYREQINVPILWWHCSEAERSPPPYWTWGELCLPTTMADKPTSSGTRAFLSKQDLVDCFATREFAMHVVAAVNPHINEIKAEISATKKLIHSQQHELTCLRGAVIAHEQQLRIQAEEIKKLKAKQDTEERNERQKILVVNGLEKENPIDHFIKIVKENLDSELKNREFSLATKQFRKRPKKQINIRQHKRDSGGH